MLPTNIILVRHGESVQNTGENTYLKLADHKVYITEKGRGQAADSAIALKSYLANKNIYPTFNPKSVRVYYSPYDRARQTMEIFNEHIEFGKYNTKIEENILITEQQFGMFDLVPKEEWETAFPNEYAIYKRIKEQRGKFWAEIPMGESPFKTAIRAKEFIGTLSRDAKENGVDTAIIFTHGTLLRVLTMLLMKYGTDWYENEYNPGNCWIRHIQNKKDLDYIYKG